MSIERITEKQSQEFISKEEDYLGSDIKYFNLTPSTDVRFPAEDGWDDVTYYTNRSKHLKFEPGTGKQFVYILTNETMPGIVKIGYTKNDPGVRAKQINAATGVAMNFNVEWAFPCFNGIELEGEVHKYLDSFRVNKNREFFRMSVEEAKSVVERLGARYVK
tara:strand:- start:1140 stop:1625 length:486 start_codon:yes stop_codon:yes gene_type:complete